MKKTNQPPSTDLAWAERVEKAAQEHASVYSNVGDARIRAHVGFIFGSNYEAKRAEGLEAALDRANEFLRGMGYDDEADLTDQALATYRNGAAK